MKKTPYELGFSMPAEWEKHRAVWLSWPHDITSFPHLEKAEGAFADFVHEISESEQVELQVLDSAMEKKAVTMLSARGTDIGRVRFHKAKYADVWFRDYGPLFVVNKKKKEVAMTKWIYNALGNKYKPLLKDNEIPYRMNEELNLAMFETNIVLEGGSIDVNGKGLVLTTKQCLLNKNRNPKLSHTDIEKYLHDYLGIEKTIWLNRGIEDDDTDGHIDDIARFVNEDTVLCAYENDTTSKNYEVLKENFEILKNATDQSGKKLNVIPIPMPGNIPAHENPLPASYANFYIGNTKVLVPVFKTVRDGEALARIQEAFPDRKVAGIDATYLVYGLGTLHCMSQQEPAV